MKEKMLNYPVLCFKVLEFIEKNGSVTRRQIQNRFQLTYNQAFNVVRVLELDGLMASTRGNAW
jgi:ribosomal protein S25